MLTKMFNKKGSKKSARGNTHARNVTPQEILAAMERSQSKPSRIEDHYRAEFDFDEASQDESSTNGSSPSLSMLSSSSGSGSGMTPQEVIRQLEHLGGVNDMDARRYFESLKATSPL